MGLSPQQKEALVASLPLLGVLLHLNELDESILLKYVCHTQDLEIYLNKDNSNAIRVNSLVHLILKYDSDALYNEVLQYCLCRFQQYHKLCELLTLKPTLQTDTIVFEPVTIAKSDLQNNMSPGSENTGCYQCPISGLESIQNDQGHYTIDWSTLSSAKFNWTDVWQKMISQNDQSGLVLHLPPIQLPKNLKNYILSLSLIRNPLGSLTLRGEFSENIEMNESAPHALRFKLKAVIAIGHEYQRTVDAKVDFFKGRAKDLIEFGAVPFNSSHMSLPHLQLSFAK